MVEEKGDWFVVNVKEAEWFENPDFGWRCRFEKEQRFEEIGVNISVLEPGKPNCRYHRENVQEGFLVLAGECLLLVNGEERRLRAWDYFHCPPGVSHNFVGAGEGPCAILMIGRRTKDIELFYPASDLAQRYNAQAPEPTADPRVAYSDVTPWRGTSPRPWPLS